MKYKILSIAAFIVLLGVPSMLLAASGNVLQNGGIGQRAGDVTNFGFAVCNHGTQNDAQSVPVSVLANNVTVTATVAPLSVGQCLYSYLPYSAFGMASGRTYTVQVSIDPSRTFAQNADTQATYSMTVPAGAVLGASTMSPAVRASLLAQLASMVTILQGLLARAQALGL